MNSRERIVDLWTALAGFRQRILNHMQPDLAGLKGMDLTLAQGQVLQHVAAAGSLTIAELQARLARAQATTSQFVSQLERRGLVERRSDPGDGRRTLVVLSRRGRRQMDRLEQIRRQGFAGVIDALPPAVQRQLLDALRATLAALGAADAPKEMP